MPRIIALQSLSRARCIPRKACSTLQPVSNPWLHPPQRPTSSIIGAATSTSPISATRTPKMIDFAVRYKNINPRADTQGGQATPEVPYPYLTLYQLNDVHWLASDEFRAVQNTLDGFEVNMRSYRVVVRSTSERGAAQAKFVVTSEIQLADPGEFDRRVHAFGAMSGHRGSVLYEFMPGLLANEQKGLTSGGLVVSWFNEMPMLQGSRHGVQDVWQLVSAFEGGKS